VSRNASKEKIEEFFARQPNFVREILRDDCLSTESMSALTQPGAFEILGEARDEYLQLLRTCPAELREFRKREEKRGGKSALFGLPPVPAGARRKDWLAEECLELQQLGMSQPEIAAELNRRHPTLKDQKGNLRPITADVVRHHLRSLRRRGSPEKI
jgi:hypothetical protein